MQILPPADRTAGSVSAVVSDGHADAPPAAGTESDRYLAAVKVLRRGGCRCMLVWNGRGAVPLGGCERAGDPLRPCADVCTATS